MVYRRSWNLKNAFFLFLSFNKIETLQPSNLSKYHPLAPAWQSDCFETGALFLRKNHAPLGFQTTLKNSCLGVSRGSKRLLMKQCLFDQFLRNTFLFLSFGLSAVTSVMSEPVTVERDGWSRQDSSLFGRTSQGCSTKTAGNEKGKYFEALFR